MHRPTPAAPTHGHRPRRTSPLTIAAFALGMMSRSISRCDAYVAVPAYSSFHCPPAIKHRSSDDAIINCGRRIGVTYPPVLRLFRELLSDDEEDLRANIAVINRQDGLDDFLGQDDRLCVIKFYAPFCKACRAFGIKFRKLATERGDRTNAAGEIVKRGDVRFGEIEYSGNIMLCKNLSITTFPAVLIFRGGEDCERLREIVCKETAIEDIIFEIERLKSPMSGT